MKVYTKKGDKGLTGLIGGTRIPKHSLRIDSYGTVDELNSYIGLCRDLIGTESIVKEMIEIQDRLFTMGSLLAADPEKNKMKLPELTEVDVTNLENWIDSYSAQLEPMKFFVLPGGHVTVSQLHVARCVCRRAERLVSQLNQEVELYALPLQYLNRLSDYIFTLCRFMAKELNIQETPWVPRS